MTAFLIKGSDFDPDFEPVLFDPSSSLCGPILKREVMKAAAEAEQMILRARLEASRIRKKAKDVLLQAEKEKEEERQKGFAEGREVGLAELTGRLLEVEVAREKMMTEAEPQVIHMVMDIAEKVIGRELKKGAVVDIVKKALEQTVGQKITLRVHPDDIKTIQAGQVDLMVLLDKSQSMTVKEDETIAPGGCVIETELGTVDARLEPQLQAIRKALGL